MLKLKPTAYILQNMCCGQIEGDDECVNEKQTSSIFARGIQAPHDLPDKVNMVIRAPEYTPVWPQADHDNDDQVDPNILGWLANGRKSGDAQSKSLMQVSICKERAQDIEICFEDEKGAPVQMKHARLQIFDIDMGKTTHKNGPEAIQFKCPGGEFMLYGNHPWMSHTPGPPYKIEFGATTHGQPEYRYKCPDGEPVTLWSTRNGTFADRPTSSDASTLTEAAEDALIMIEYRDVTCATITLANMPPSYRQEPWSDKVNYKKQGGKRACEKDGGKMSGNYCRFGSKGWPLKSAWKGGNPLNTTKKLQNSNFAGLGEGPCGHWQGGRNWLFSGYYNQMDPLECHPPMLAEAEPKDKAEVQASKAVENTNVTARSTLWFDSHEHCSSSSSSSSSSSTDNMKSFGWTVESPPLASTPHTFGTGCDGGLYHFWVSCAAARASSSSHDSASHAIAPPVCAGKQLGRVHQYSPSRGLLDIHHRVRPVVLP